MSPTSRPTLERDGFDDAFGTLFRRAYAAALRVTSDSGAASDIAQESMIRAYVRWWRIHRYADRWVVRVAINLAIDHARKANRETRMPLTDLPQDGEGFTAEDVLDLRTALRVLSRRQREVIALRFLVGLTIADVGAVLGCSQGAVKSHTARAIQKLRSEMQ